jgi:glycosyltransferase involved in cell wall biosynthesis
MSVKNMNVLEKWLAKAWRSYLYRLDQKRSKEVDVWVANSQAIKHKIKEAYGVEAIVVYPPVDVKRFEDEAVKQQGSKAAINGGSDARTLSSNFFFVVSRLGEYKRVDVIVQAFNKLGWPLKVVGRGPQAPYLKQIAKDNVQIYDALPDTEVTALYQGCRAFVIAANEDFGITPVEAMACGKPVIALGQGGFLETVVEGKTGTFFTEQTVDSLVAALKKFDGMQFDQKIIKARANEFGLEAFQEKMRGVVGNATKSQKSKM